MSFKLFSVAPTCSHLLMVQVAVSRAALEWEFEQAG